MNNRGKRPVPRRAESKNALAAKISLLISFIVSSLRSFINTVLDKFFTLRRNFLRDLRLRRARVQMKNAKIANGLDLYNDFDPGASQKEQGKISFWQHHTYFIYNGLSRIDAAYNALVIKLRDNSLAFSQRCSTNAKSSRRGGPSFNIYDVLLVLALILPLIFRFVYFVLRTLKQIGGAFLNFVRALEHPSRSLALMSAFFKKNTKILLPLSLAIFTAFSIYNTLSQDVELAIYIDGEYIGIVQSADMLNETKLAVENHISDSVGFAYSFDKNISYEFCRMEDGDELLSYSNLHRVLYERATSDYVTAYALCVDGKMIGALSSYSEAERLIEDVKQEQIKSLGLSAIDGTVQISNNVRIINQLCLPENVMRADDLKSLMLGDSSRIDIDISISTSLSGITGNIHPSDDPIQNDTDALLESIKLKFEVEKLDVVQEKVSFKVVYEPSSYYYDGEIVLKQNGVAGKKEVIYNVVYKDGVEVDRVPLIETVISAPTSAVYYVGTKEKPSTDPTGTFIYPLKQYILTSDYGSRTLFGEYDFHLGLDLYAPHGTSIYAADGGEVIFAGENSSYGYLTLIDHKNGFVSAYAHQSEILVNVGDLVFQGQHIGRVGDTGVATGPHVHFEIRKNGVIVNPNPYLN